MSRKFHLFVIFLIYNLFEINGKKKAHNDKLKINLEPETDNPEFVTNGRNVVGPEFIVAGDFLFFVFTVSSLLDV